MSTVTTSATPSSVDKLIEPMSKTSMKSPQPPTWTISPVVHVRRDVFSRIVEFDGRVEVRGIMYRLRRQFNFLSHT